MRGKREAKKGAFCFVCLFDSLFLCFVCLFVGSRAKEVPKETNRTEPNRTEPDQTSASGKFIAKLSALRSTDSSLPPLSISLSTVQSVRPSVCLGFEPIQTFARRRAGRGPFRPPVCLTGKRREETGRLLLWALSAWRAPKGTALDNGAPDSRLTNANCYSGSKTLASSTNSLSLSLPSPPLCRPRANALSNTSLTN